MRTDLRAFSYNVHHSALHWTNSTAEGAFSAAVARDRRCAAVPAKMDSFSKIGSMWQALSSKKASSSSSNVPERDAPKARPPFSQAYSEDTFADSLPATIFEGKDGNQFKNMKRKDRGEM